MNKICRWTLAGCIGLVWIQPGMAEREVKVQRYGDIAFAKTLQFPASAVNLQLADIAAETSGRIIQFPVQVGDLVEQGKLLIELDCRAAEINRTRIKAGIRQSMARRQLTRQQLERAKRLSSSSSISREELDQRQTQLEADNAGIEEQEASLESIQQSIDNCKVRAPFSGMVVEKLSATGSYASAGAPQLKLLKPDAVEIQLEIPPDRINQLKKAASLQFESSGVNYRLKLRKVLPLVDSASLQQIVRLEVIQSPLPPGGSLGLVSFDTDRKFVPASLVQKRNGQLGVFILSDNRANFISLENAEEGQSVATDLAEDALVITNQLQLLEDKEPVSIQP